VHAAWHFTAAMAFWYLNTRNADERNHFADIVPAGRRAQAVVGTTQNATRGTFAVDDRSTAI
jgi:hypothetical protein